jgi:hypothetical protein
MPVILVMPVPDFAGSILQLISFTSLNYSPSVRSFSLIFSTLDVCFKD